jgi:hypothetical protein
MVKNKKKKEIKVLGLFDHASKDILFILESKQLLA